MKCQQYMYMQYIYVYCRSLEDVLNYDQSDLEEMFCLNFMTTREVFGEKKNFELIPGGENVPVTTKNKYVNILHCIRNYRW